MQYVYQSPKTKLRSAPVDEDDSARRTDLEAAGWKIVETIGSPAVVTVNRVEQHAMHQEPTPLPDDIPCRDLLIDAGIADVESLKAALAGGGRIRGIGEARTAALRSYLDPEQSEA